MYFLIPIILLFILIPIQLEKKYINIIYIKIFIISIIYFYILNIFNDSILLLLFTITVYIIICILIHRLDLNYLELNKKDNNLYSLAHEVKNPLTVCKGYLDMLDINNKEKLERYIPIIKKEMNRSLTIMNNFLDLKRITLNKELMDFSLLIDDIEETTRIILKENNINFNIMNTSKEIILDGDYDKLKQVLMNLIKNSYEAESSNIKLEFKIINKYLRIKIIDDGVGISKDDLKKIGNMFYTTKPTGTGVGVSLSKEILKLHGGNLSYSSSFNKGTIATISLPIKYIFE